MTWRFVIVYDKGYGWGRFNLSGIQRQSLQNDAAANEEARSSPDFTKMDEETDKAKEGEAGDEANKGNKKRAGSAKRSKTVELSIHEDQIIAAETPVISIIIARLHNRSRGSN